MSKEKCKSKIIITLLISLIICIGANILVNIHFLNELNTDMENLETALTNFNDSKLDMTNINLNALNTKIDSLNLANSKELGYINSNLTSQSNNLKDINSSLNEINNRELNVTIDISQDELNAAISSTLFNLLIIPVGIFSLIGGGILIYVAKVLFEHYSNKGLDKLDEKLK